LPPCRWALRSSAARCNAKFKGTYTGVAADHVETQAKYGAVLDLAAQLVARNQAFRQKLPHDADICSLFERGCIAQQLTLHLSARLAAKSDGDSCLAPVKHVYRIIEKASFDSPTGSIWTVHVHGGSRPGFDRCRLHYAELSCSKVSVVVFERSGMSVVRSAASCRLLRASRAGLRQLAAEGASAGVVAPSAGEVASGLPASPTLPTAPATPSSTARWLRWCWAWRPC
jgi:hypothetical protein